MKIIKALRFILAFSVAVLVLDAACLQHLTSYSAIEIPAEEPVDEDVTDDLEDDKEHNASGTHMQVHYPSITHYTNYLLNHTHQVQETFSPPPEG